MEPLVQASGHCGDRAHQFELKQASADFARRKARAGTERFDIERLVAHLREKRVFGAILDASR